MTEVSNFTKTVVTNQLPSPLYAGYKVVMKYILVSRSLMTRTNNDQMEWL